MSKKVTPRLKADRLITECKEINIKAFELDDSFNNDFYQKSNIRASGMALIIVDEIIESSYWWQFKRKLFFQAVKIEIYVRMAEFKDILNRINK